MANVNEIWENVLLIADKDYLGGFSPDQINTAIPQAERELWSELTDKMQLSRGLENLDNRFYESSTINSSILDTFKVTQQYLVPQDGKLPKPLDLKYISSVSHRVYYPSGNYQDVRVYPITDGQKSARLASNIVPPTLEHPIIMEYNTYYEFAPVNIGNVNLTYLRMPIPAFWGYTLVLGEPVYDPNTSINSEFPDECIPVLSLKVASLLGIQLKDASVVNYTEKPAI